MTYGNLGNAFTHSQYHKAIKYHTKHLEIAIEVGDRAGEGMPYTNLGNAYDSLGRSHKANRYHTRHLSGCDQGG